MPDLLVEKIFWHYDTNGKNSSVTSIEVTTNDLRMVCGVSFIYASGVRSTLGYDDEGSKIIMNLEPSESLIRVDLDNNTYEGFQHIAVS
jgi:hypothetical protein